MLKYLELQHLCDATFVLFLISWPYTRHYLFNLILLSVYFDLPGIFHRDNHNSPTYQTIPRTGGRKWKEGFSWNPQAGYYMTSEVLMAFIALLVILQVILLLWFAMIVRLAIRIIGGGHAEDDRSDDEAEDDSNIDNDSISNTKENIPSKPSATGTTMANGIAFSNGIHRRK
jgi:very-long-chain ceramide synthase